MLYKWKSSKVYKFLIIVLFLVLSFAIIKHIYFSLNDQRLVLYEDNMYAKNSIDVCCFLENVTSGLSKSDLSCFLTDNFIQNVSLIDIYFGFLLFVFGKSFLVFRLAMLPLFMFFLFAIYLFERQQSGINFFSIGILFVLSSPVFISFSRICTPSLYLTSWLILAMFFWGKSDNFKKSIYVVLMSSCLAICLIIHYSSILYVFIFCMFVCFLTFSKSNCLFVISISFLFCLNLLYLSGYVSFFLFFLFLFLFRRKKELLNFVFLWMILSVTFYGGIIEKYLTNFGIYSTSGIATKTKLIIMPLKIIIQNLSLLFPNNLSFLLFLILFVCAIYCFFLKTCNMPRILFLLFFLAAPGIGSILLIPEIGTHVLIPSFAMLFLFVSIFVDRLKSIGIKISIGLFLIVNVMFIDLGFFIPESFGQEAAYVDYREWGKENLKFFFKDNNIKSEHILTIGLLAEPFRPNSYSPLEKLSLQFLSDRRIEIKEIFSMDDLMDMIRNKKLDYVFVEKHHRLSINNQGIEEKRIFEYFLENPFLIKYKTIFTCLKNIFIFKIS